MARSIPTYRERGATFEADTCLPVRRAVEAGQLEHKALVHGHYPGQRLPRNVLPGVKVVGFWNAEHRQTWGLDWHCNEGMELTFLKSGRLDFAVEDQQCVLQAGDFTFTRPWQRHRVGDPNIDAGRLHFLILDVGVRQPHQSWRWPSWIILTPDDLRQLTEFLRHNEQPAWQASQEVVRAFTSMATDVESDDNASSASNLAVHINQLFLALLQMFRKQEIYLDRSLSSVRRTVELFWGDLCRDRNLQTLEWTVHAMARRCGMGATGFIQHTKQLFNMTPMQYLNHCRLNAAAQMLTDQSSLSITEIALNCGFASSQYFATLFHRRFGVPPREYRNQQ